MENSTTEFQNMLIEDTSSRKSHYLNYFDSESLTEGVTTPALFYEDSFKFFNLEKKIDSNQTYRAEELYEPLKSYFEIRFVEQSIRMRQEDYGMTGEL